jgi:hypothetical protein
MLGVQVGDQGADLFAEDPLEGGGQRLDHRHLHAEAAQTGGRLGADETHSDHDGLGRLGGAGSDGGGISQGAQPEDTVQLRTGHVQTARATPGCHNHRVCGQP